MWMVLMVVAQLGTDPALVSRIEAMELQIEALGEIELPGELQDEKAERIADLTAALHAAGITDASIDRVYDRKEALRTWLFDHAAEQPSMPPGEFVDEGEVWEVRTPDLTLSIRKRDLAMTVVAAEETWEFGPGSPTDVLLQDETAFSLASARARRAEAFRTGYSMGMTLVLSSFPKAPELELGLHFDLCGAELTVMLVGVKDIPNLDRIEWPRAIRFEAEPANVSVIPNMQGILIPGDWPQAIARAERVHSRTLTMPWWGQIREGGGGVMTYYVSADDAGVDYQHPAGGPTRIQPRWLASLGSIRYPRVMRYAFDGDASYVSMAKRYRRHLRETGQFVSLAEKAVAVPNVNAILGRPYIWLNALNVNVEGSRFFLDERRERNWRLRTFEDLAAELRRMKAAGVENLYFHLGGYNTRGYDSRHPDHLPPSPEAGGWEGLRRLRETCEELGYFFVLHDQYRDYYLDAVSFDERMTITNADGGRDEHAEWAGGRQTYLSSWFQPGYVRRNHDLLASRGIALQGVFVDVFSVVPLEESFQPLHPLTRTDCARLRRECFALLRDRGLVVSSEEPTDYLAPDLHLTLRGAYPVGEKGYGAGEGIGIAVPLFNLVFHDSLIHPWHITRDGGWGIPQGDAGWLHCMLNAGMPALSLGMVQDEGLLERLSQTAELMKRLAFQEMVDHAFLDPERRRQRGTYADGTIVTVDFEAGTCVIE